jgi:hypothetical protein
MKFHAALWWENLQNARENQGKDNIRVWQKMLKCMKMNWMPLDYQQFFFGEFQNLRQKDLSIPAFTKEFLRPQIRTRLQEDDENVIEIYMNALRFQLQDELALIKVNSMDEAYHLVLKEREKLNR